VAALFSCTSNTTKTVADRVGCAGFDRHAHAPMRRETRGGLVGVACRQCAQVALGGAWLEAGADSAARARRASAGNEAEPVFFMMDAR